MHLAIVIQNTQNTKGIQIENVAYRSSQFADDTSLLLDVSYISLNPVLHVLHNFAVECGLKINFDKINLIRMDSKKYRTHSIKTKNKTSVERSKLYCARHHI